jgi:transcription termination/antitermination protein NusG
MHTGVMDDQFRPGDLVKVTSGPLSGFSGGIIDVDTDERKLTVRFDIFDRRVPVELHLDQVERLD